MEQPALSHDDGPIGLVLAPTRELCQQIHAIFCKYAKLFTLNVLPVFGGVDPHVLWKQIKHKVNEICISTPGKLMEFLKKKAFTLTSRCTFLVIDEADRMFDLGFEYQLRSIVNQIRPDRQTLMFSATFPKKVQELACDILNSCPVKISIGKPPDDGSRAVANEDVDQKVLIFDKE